MTETKYLKAKSDKLVTLFGDPDQRTREQLYRCMEYEDAGSHGVLCADSHVGYSMPIGGVIGYANHVSPSGVGYDIGCGNLAVRTSIKADSERIDIEDIVTQISHRIQFGMGKDNPRPVDHPVIDAIEQAGFGPVSDLAPLAKRQLGTVGGGNHYVDLFRGEDGFLWIGVHFGSRGFGHKVATGFMAMAQGLGFEDRPNEGGMDGPPILIQADSELGQAYIEGMELAGAYADAGRIAVAAEVMTIIGTNPIRTIHNHHNYAWKETHFGEELWVVRKGSTPAFPGQEGFVGSSMGDASVILRGRDTDEAKEAMYSAPHGAGRRLSRTEAKGKTKMNKETGKVRVIKKAQINWSEVQQDLAAKGIALRGGAADEAPGAYKNLDEVLDFHKLTLEVTEILQPIGVVMG